MIPWPALIEDLCEDMHCPEIFRVPDCDGQRCPVLRRIMRGVAIYMIAGDDARFVGVLDKREH